MDFFLLFPPFPLFSLFFFFFFSALQFVEFLGFITVYRHTLASLVILIETARNIFTAILFRMNLDSGANNTDFRPSENYSPRKISFRFTHFASYKVLLMRSLL